MLRDLGVKLMPIKLPQKQNMWALTLILDAEAATAFDEITRQGITEGLVSMSMNFFAFFPALANPTTNKHAKVTGYFASPKGPTGKVLKRELRG